MPYRLLNPDLCADRLIAEEQAAGQEGYCVDALLDLRIEADGETVTFQRQDGSRVYMDQDRLEAILRRPLMGA